MLAPATALHEKVTGEVTVALSAGAVSVVAVPQAVCAPPMKVDLAETISGQFAKEVATHQVTVPSGTRRVSDVAVVVPERSPEVSPASAMNSL